MELNNPQLKVLEEFLSETIKANYYLTFDDLNPKYVTEQIAEQLAENRFEWVDNTIYVPNLLTISAPGSTPDKIEELEVIFNSVVFIKYLYEYMTESNYRLFDFVKIEIEPVSTPHQHINLKFFWPSPEEVREDFTVLLNKQEGKILQVFAPKAEIPLLARLTAFNGEPYRSDYVITKQVTYLGRLRNVTDRESNHMIRRNDFIFARHPDPLSVNSSVSRLHAKIVYENGQFALYDTGSANGTSIIREDQTLELPRAEISGQPLQNNDLIVLGSAQIQFNLISGEEAATLVSMPPEKLESEEVENFSGDLPKTVDDTFSMSKQEMLKNLRLLENES
ncbi:MAG: FHA domain-containing protein [Acidobacteria bacterium]|nr:FHA domain-containing protein [Acidobacteriota bacterium]